MPSSRALVLIVLGSVLAGLVVASAAVLTVNAGTLAVYTFSVKLTATPPRCDDDEDDRKPQEDRRRFSSATATAYSPGALGTTSATPPRTNGTPGASDGKQQGCDREGSRGPRPPRFQGPSLGAPATTPTAFPVPSGPRFRGPPAKR